MIIINFIYFLGLAQCPISSLVNHSCAPNVFRAVHKKSFVLVANQIISVGEQIFDSCGVYYVYDKKSVRQEAIKKGFGINCDCIACVHDYPILDEMTPKNNNNLYHDTCCQMEMIEKLEMTSGLKPKFLKAMLGRCTDKLRAMEIKSKHREKFEIMEDVVFLRILLRRLLLSCDNVKSIIPYCVA